MVLVRLCSVQDGKTTYKEKQTPDAGLEACNRQPSLEIESTCRSDVSFRPSTAVRITDRRRRPGRLQPQSERGIGIYRWERVC